MLRFKLKMNSILRVALAIVALSFSYPKNAIAHPVSSSAEDLEAMRDYIQYARESLAACSGSEHIADLERAAHERHTNWLNSLRPDADNGDALRRRDYNTVLKTNHKSNLTGITPNTPASVLFANTVACILQPEVTEGPYWVSNEVLRKDIREDRPGVDLYLDLQFIDIKTCKPATGFYVDLWNANATGVYSGVGASAKVNSLRGISAVDSEGVVQFITKYPAAYDGRTNHVHLITAKTGTLNPTTNTYLISGATHIGQIFFDQTLNDQIRALPPYSSVTSGNKVTNANDFLFKGAAGANFDPIVNYVQLGSTLNQGVFGWIRIGIDTTKTYTPKAAARYNPSAASFTVQN